MKRLKSADSPRQQRWEHGGREFSIVDLAVMPFREEAKKEWLPEVKDFDKFHKRFEEIALSTYGEYHYELADISGEKIEIVGRYLSYDQAKEGIKAWVLSLENEQQA